MDIWKYYSITHKKHVVCNPTSEEKINRLCKLLDLQPGSKVIDIGCGKGELLVRLALLYDIRATGVDISPFFVNELNEKIRKHKLEDKLNVLIMDGAKFKPDKPESFDVSICLGVSWIWKDFVGMLNAQKSLTKPSGIIVAGEPFWMKPPSKEYLEATEIQEEQFSSSHELNVLKAEALGLKCIYSMVSNQDEWDNYETLQWWAVDEYAKNNRDDPDLPELMSKKDKDKSNYLKWERSTLGWAIYVFRKL